MIAIAVTDLTKTYGEVLANDEVSFRVAEGEVFGYLGPNGAGKTTTIRTLMGFQSPTSGSATVLGTDVRDEAAFVETRRRVGYLPANLTFDRTATGTEILDLHAGVKGDERREELLELFDAPVDRPVRDYSTGQVQKLGLVQAFMHDPDLVVMDEPTSGLDPLMQRRFEEFVREECRSGTTVFLSSHVLSEVRAICDRVGIIRDGRIVTVESVRDLLGRSGKLVRARVVGGPGEDEVDLADAHDVSVRPLDPDYAGEEGSSGGHGGDDVAELTFVYTGDVDALVRFLDRQRLLDLDVEEAPLERVFMRFYDDGATAAGGEA